MSNLKKIAATVIVVIILIVGVMAYNVFRTPEQASAPIEAIPLAESSSAPAASPSAAAQASPATEATTATTDEPAASEAAPTETAETVAEAATTATASDPVVVQIVQEESEARFVIDEVLNNAPKTVVGTTDQVAGEIAIDPQNPANTRVGIIQVNARTIITDSEFRNRAIKNEILETDTYEFVTFTPTEITGLPESGAVGETYTFQIAGDLTIRDVTRPVTFDVTVTPTSDTRVEGIAVTTIRYADFEITIPQVRQVASVDENVRLEIDFVAAAS